MSTRSIDIDPDVRTAATLPSWFHSDAEMFDRVREGESAFDLPDGARDSGKRVAADYWWLWPNPRLDFHPWGLSIDVVRPLAVGSTRVSFLTCVCRPEKLERGARAGLDRVEREDEAVVETVQRGVRSRLYDRGRDSPTREQGVHRFHRLLAEALR